MSLHHAQDRNFLASSGGSRLLAKRTAQPREQRQCGHGTEGRAPADAGSRCSSSHKGCPTRASHRLHPASTSSRGARWWVPSRLFCRSPPLLCLPPSAPWVRVISDGPSPPPVPDATTVSWELCLTGSGGCRGVPL